MIYDINPENPQPRLIAKVVDELKKGGVIAYPTDTVYGIGCDISNYAHVSNRAYRVMRHLLPGPYTFILKATRLVPKLMVSKRKTVGIRVPDNNICLEILKMLGHPIVSTSASFSEYDIFTDAQEIDIRLGHILDIIINGGDVGTEPSTVIDLTDDENFVVLREGKGEVSMFLT
ncbi:threonylcarbamoyl-AMP synthase [candidate division KSB1 bacterium 4484_87]|nr:MAG: threonylcarbamoyl-AMP synthase [candidate division KSB1 bacterium 4484_87]